MITVSEEWKELHKRPLLPETFVEIQLDVTDLDVTGLVSIGGTNQARFSNTDSIVNVKVTPPDEQYAFLEYNLWSLDGSKSVISDLDTYEPPGFVSKNSDTSSMRISLTEIRSAGTPGFTITWSSEYGEYATDFTIDVKQGDYVVGTTTVTGNTSNVSQVELEVSDYDTVIITVNEWSVPEHRIRIDGVTFGCAIVFDKNQILSYSHEQTGDPFGSEISKNSVEFSVDNTDGRWDLLNPGSLEKYLYERQPLTVRYGMQTTRGIEWIQAGVFYLTEWRAPSNGFEATFVARDAFEFMQDTTHSRSHQEGVTTKEVPAYASSADIFTDGTAVATIATNTAVKVFESDIYRANGSQEINAPGRLVYRLEQGWVNADFVTIVAEGSLSDEIDKALNQMTYTKQLNLTWTKDAALKAVLPPRSIPEVNVGEFIQRCVNACGCAMWQNADGVLCFSYPSRALSDYLISKETSYSHPEIELAKPLKQIKVVCYSRSVSGSMTKVFDVANDGAIITLDNPYMWYNAPGRIEGQVKRYSDWWSNRGWVSGDFRADPRLGLFDVVSVESKHGLISPVMITQIRYSYNGSFRGTYKGKILSVDFVETVSSDGEVMEV